MVFCFRETHFVVITTNVGISFKNKEGEGSKQSYFMAIT